MGEAGPKGTILSKNRPGAGKSRKKSTIFDFYASFGGKPQKIHKKLSLYVFDLCIRDLESTFGAQNASIFVTKIVPAKGLSSRSFAAGMIEKALQ